MVIPDPSGGDTPCVLSEDPYPQTGVKPLSTPEYHCCGCSLSLVGSREREKNAKSGVSRLRDCITGGDSVC